MIRDLKEAADRFSKRDSRNASPNRTLEIESIVEEKPEWDPQLHEQVK
jgi:hypothetical protein